MGKPARTQPTVTARRDGSLYSSHRISRSGLRRWDDPATVGLPTMAALKLHGKQTRRETNRRAKLAQRQRRIS